MIRIFDQNFLKVNFDNWGKNEIDNIKKREKIYIW